MRGKLVEGTLGSAQAAFRDHPRTLYDNGSTDGSEEWLRQVCAQHGFSYVRVSGENTSPGGGRSGCIPLCRPLIKPETVVVWSDDDIEWRADAAEILEGAWPHVPPDVVLVGGHLEPVFRWSQITESIVCGPSRVLIRESTPGTIWCFRGADLSLFDEVVHPQFGYDYRACTELRAKGRRIAQLDLGSHTGGMSSTHGNYAAEDHNSRPLDREKWGV
ncbi:MAG: glycosyltransferase family 2 protein [bacterium]|nr:glycosyltransferase family 2 protein [bacterium]